MKEIKVGDVIWKAGCQWEENYIPCPVCYGRKAVRITLGNGDIVPQDCQYCRSGYSAPTGVIKDSKYIATPKSVAITEIRTTTKIETTIVEYISDYYVLSPNSVYRTKAEAEVKCLELMKEAEKNDLIRLRQKKSSDLEKMVYSIGYHKSQITQFKKDIARHESCILMCKEEKK